MDKPTGAQFVRVFKPLHVIRTKTRNKRFASRIKQHASMTEIGRNQFKTKSTSRERINVIAGEIILRAYRKFRKMIHYRK